MSNIFSENILWSIGTIIVLFGVLAAHRLASHRNKQGHFRAKASAFESTIKRELSEIYPVASNWPENIDGYLRSKFPTLQAAVSQFSETLTKRDKVAFNKVWFIYRLGHDGREIDQQCYHQYMGFSSPDKPYKDPKESFHENVSRLLSYAKQT
ncbi:MAG: hypothetical protein L3J98_11695 [Gammaproteobacteria bacterium]|nr:hypothetical protein [Gammaproteobacteria bacterium]MCF6260801.1 hypothetical protein [Gammaproteobacteria bacterium]